MAEYKKFIGSISVVRMIEENCWKCKRTREQIIKDFGVYPRRWICHRCYYEMMVEIRDLKAKIKYMEKKYVGDDSTSKIISEFKKHNSLIVTSLDKMQKEAKKIKDVV